MNAEVWLAAATLAFAGAATAATPAPGMEKNGMLVDAKGMTLYTYDKDSNGMSACNGKCAENWPPLAAMEGAAASGEWALIKREDGSMQWAYDGHPLYGYAMDKQAPAQPGRHNHCDDHGGVTLRRPRGTACGRIRHGRPVAATLIHSVGGTGVGDSRGVGRRAWAPPPG
jgi:predicted lipoprotein with Yx(FWY)xxD motif